MPSAELTIITEGTTPFEQKIERGLHVFLRKSKIEERMIATKRHLLVLLYVTLLACNPCRRCQGLSVRPTKGTSEDSSARAFKIISTNKNGGRSHTFIIDTKRREIMEGINNNNNSSRMALSQMKSRSWYSLFENLKSGFRSTFLPSGFPTKTPPGYLRYAIWSWIQDLSTQLRGVLATQRILEGVGVGREGATALSALLNYLVRDGCGMLASLVFTSTAAPFFRTDVKRWRLFADIMVDIGITLEVAATQVPPALFLPMISVGNMCKAMCGVAAGACSGPINLHWAKGSDISDISAKFGAQNTVTGSLGIVFAAVFARSVSILPMTPLWILYGVLTFLHIVANRRCMRLIAFDSFSTVRMDIVIAQFLKEYEPSTSKPIELPTPNDVASQEPLLFTTITPNRPTHPIVMGVSFNEFVDHTTEHTREAPGLLVGMENYWIAVGKGTRNPQILVALPENISPADTAKAYFHARLLDDIMVTNPSISIKDAESVASTRIENAWKEFQQQASRTGWDVRQTELKNKGYELAVQPL